MNMRKILFVCCALVATLTAQAYDYNYAGCFTTTKLTYTSIDENNAPITLSEMVTLPLEKDKTSKRQIGFNVLTSMPYTDDESQSATSTTPLDALILRTIATEGAMVVHFDGQGHGESYGKQILQLANKLTARQAIDGLLAAMDYAKNQGYTFSSDYYTISAGYSLAGGVAVAVQRYLEKYSSAEEKAKVNLRKTVAGSAPINATEVVKNIIKNMENNSGSSDYYVPILKHCCEAYKKTTLRTIDLDKLFIGGETVELDSMKEGMQTARAVWKVVGKEDMDVDWTPETPITMFHRTDDDGVTYNNTLHALNSWGSDKFKVINEGMPGMKWNVSMFSPVREPIVDYLASSTGYGTHVQGVVDYYLGMVDGCLRDKDISYGTPANFKNMLDVVFDLASYLNMEIPVDESATIQDMTVTIKTLGNLHCSGTILNDDGSTQTTFDVTLKPSADSKSNTKITTVDASGYLNLPLEFTITLPDAVGSTDAKISGTCNDCYKLVEQLTAILLHRTLTDKSKAQTYCDAINNNLKITAKLSAISGDVEFDLTRNNVGKWYSPSYEYTIDLYIKSGLISAKLADYIDDLDSYTTIDNQKISINDYTATFHVTNKDYSNGKVTFYADVVDPDGTQVGKVDMVATGVNMNTSGTEQTMNLAFTAYYYENGVSAGTTYSVTGTCSNLNDAALAGILCYGNMSCPTEADALKYASAVNSNISATFTATDSSSEYYYLNGGSLNAVAKQDDLGAWYTQYCVNKDGKNIPLSDIIKF